MQQTTLIQNVQQYRAGAVSKGVQKQEGLFTKFFTWADAQEKNRFLWLTISILGHIGAVLPITVYVILNTGNNFALLATACIINVPVLALNLAAQPPKVTLPFLFIAWLADIILIATCVVTYFAL